MLAQKKLFSEKVSWIELIAMLQTAYIDNHL